MASTGLRKRPRRSSDRTFKPSYGNVDLTWTGSVTRDGQSVIGVLADQNGWRMRLQGGIAVDCIHLSAFVVHVGSVFGPWTDNGLRDGLDRAGTAAEITGELTLADRAWTGWLKAVTGGRVEMEGRTERPGEITLRGRG